MAKVVMCNLMSNDHSNLGICAAELVKTACKINITPWWGKCRDSIHPRNLNKQAVVLWSPCLETVFYSLDAIKRPSLRLEVNSLVQLVMEPLPKRCPFFKWKITSHFIFEFAPKKISAQR